MSKHAKKNLPARGWHVPAAVLAVLLTLALWATQLGVISMWALTSKGLHERVVLDRATVDAQMTRIAEAIAGIGAEYGFDLAAVQEAVTRESVEELNRQTVAWWTRFGAEGELKEAPAYHAELKNVLEKDQQFIGSLDEMTVNSTIEQVEARVDAAVRKSAIMIRDELLYGGIRRAGDRINIPKVLELVRKLPGLGGAACLLLAGLIALVLSRKIQLAGQYIGGALSGCGLLILLTLGLLKAMNLATFIGEASEALQSQYLHLARILTMESIGGAVFLMIVGGMLMTWAVKTRRKIA